MKRGFRYIAMLAVLCILLGGCSVPDKTVTVEDLTITVPGKYVDCSGEDFAEGFSFIYGYQDLAVMGIREEISAFQAYGLDLTLEDYLDLVLEANGITEPAQQMDGILTFSFTSETDGESHTYLAAVFESSEAFWLIQTGCLAENYQKNLDTFRQILNSVTVS